MLFFVVSFNVFRI